MYLGLYKTPNKALSCLVLSCLCQRSGHDIARPYETFREQRFRASTFQTFLGGWREGGVPQILPLARTLGDSRSTLLYMYLNQKSRKGPALNYQNVTGQLGFFFYVFRVVIQNDRQKLKADRKLYDLQKGTLDDLFSNRSQVLTL